jgi:uncharacterized membrane protein
MESRAKAIGHPIHPMLIVFPLGLLTVAVVLDVIGAFVDNPLLWTVAYWNLGIGVATGVVAAVFGAWDWLAIPRGTRAKAVGLLHGVGNVIVMLLFATSWLLRQDAPSHEPPLWALILELAGAGVAGVTGWLGGELVYRLSVGVDDGANVDAPSSLGESKRLPGRPRPTAPLHT